MKREILSGLGHLAAQERKLDVQKRIGIKRALANGMTRAEVAKALGITPAQLDYLDGTKRYVAAKKARPSVRTKLPGESVADYAARTGQKLITVQKQVQQGRFPGKVVEVPVGKRVYHRIISA